MEAQTNLRALRLRNALSLMELAAASGLSNQHISRVELGEVPPTAQLEDKLGAAVETVIARRRVQLTMLEQCFASCRGRLLQPAEEGSHES